MIPMIDRMRRGGRKRFWSSLCPLCLCVRCGKSVCAGREGPLYEIARLRADSKERHVSACPSRLQQKTLNAAKGKRQTGAIESMWLKREQDHQNETVAEPRKVI
jgi:hypothetical protein